MMDTPQNGYSAVYSQMNETGTCPGGTGCAGGSNPGFLGLPQLYSGLTQQQQQQMTSSGQPAVIQQQELQYLNGFLRSQIGRKVKVEFLIGASTLTDRIGVLVGVGANYILLNEIETDDLLACDFYNIKFIRFYY